MLVQSENLIKRLAERKKSRDTRSLSMAKGINQSLTLNFNPLKNKEDPNNSVRKIPALRKLNSSLYFGGALGHSNLGNDSFISGGRSATTSGGGLANKISLAMSRVV